MRMFLDTHAFLWFVNDDPQLSETAASLIEDEANDTLISIASIWELSVKVGLGKLALAGSIEQFLPEQIFRNGFEVVSITLPDALEVAKLPLHHREPFDRLLIAQTQIRELPIISADGPGRLWH